MHVRFFFLNKRAVQVLKVPAVCVHQNKNDNKKHYSILVSSALTVGISIGLCGIGYNVIRIPPPDKNNVEAVIGKYFESELPKNSNNYVLQTVAHRGAGLDAPENSLAAFKMCCKEECQAIEFDIGLTADNVPIVFHDETLERMADLKLIVKESLWEELSKVDISVKHPLKDKFSPIRIPTFEEAIKQILKCSNQHMFIDLKGIDTKVTQIVIDLFQKYPELHSKAVVSSFFPHLIYLIRRKNPNIVCSLAWQPNLFSHNNSSTHKPFTQRRTQNVFVYLVQRLCDKIYDWFLPRLTYKILGLSLILLHKDSITKNVVLNWQNKNVRVVAWTVNCPKEKHYFHNILRIPYMTDTLKHIPITVNVPYN